MNNPLKSVCAVQIGILFLCGHAFFAACRAETMPSNALGLGISVLNGAFVPAEPVPVTIGITNRSQNTIEVVSMPEPEYGFLRFRVTDPQGRERIPGPLGWASIERVDKIALNPGGTLTYTALLLFGVVDGVGKFLIDKTGKYTVQALYDAEGTGKAISSEPITITVVEAKAVDTQAQRLFMGREQGLLASGCGKDQAAIDSFQRILREYPTSRYAAYAGFYLGMHYQRGGDYKQSIELFERILKDYKDFPVWADVMYQLAIAYRETGRKDKARQCISQLISKEPSHLLARRGKKLLGEL